MNTIWIALAAEAAVAMAVSAVAVRWARCRFSGPKRRESEAWYGTDTGECGS